MTSSMGLMTMVNRLGPNTDPWNQPLRYVLHSRITTPIFKARLLSGSYDSNYLSTCQVCLAYASNGCYDLYYQMHHSGLLNITTITTCYVSTAKRMSDFIFRSTVSVQYPCLHELV